MAPTMRATVRPTGDRGPTVLPGQRRYERSRPPVAGPGLRLGRLLGPVSVVRWVPWSAVPLVPPLGLALENGWPIKRMRVFMGGGTDGVVCWVNRRV